MKYASNIDKYLECVNKFFDDKYKKQMIGLYNEYGSSTTSKRCVNHRRNIFRNIAKNCNSGMYYDYLLNNTNTESNSKNNTVNVNINM